VIKQAPSLGRTLAMVGFTLSCFGLLLFLWLAFGGATPLKPTGYRFQTSFGEATQLAVEADVRISGVPVGKVKTIDVDRRSGRSDVAIELERDYAPLPRDSRAILRQKTLLGETYVELTPGNRSRGTLPEGGTLQAGQVSETVEFDEVLRAFDPRTRAALQSWLQTLATSVDGRGRDISDALGRLAPFAEDATRLLEVLHAQDPSVRRLVRDTGTVAGALSARDAELRRLIENAGRVISTTADRDAQLSAAVAALAPFQREAARMVPRLAAFARTANPLVTQLRPAARELSPVLGDVARLSPDLRALFEDLRPAIAASRRGLPALERFLDDLRPLLGEVSPPLRQLTPMLSFLGAYRGEASAFFANAVAATQAKVAGGGHYLRTTNPLNAESLAQYPLRAGTNRTNPYAAPGAFRRLAQGLLSFETRHCGRAAPRLVDDSQLGAFPADLAANVRKFALGGETPGKAPACVKQDGGFPQVRATPSRPGS
jgi:virulence factor Mce-like protein